MYICHLGLTGGLAGLTGGLGGDLTAGLTDDLTKGLMNGNDNNGLFTSHDAVGSSLFTMNENPYQNITDTLLNINNDPVKSTPRASFISYLSGHLFLIIIVGWSIWKQMV
jgi:hypothetical protein